jgi:predicted lipid-binding transport protein (Tim44 family)
MKRMLVLFGVLLALVSVIVADNADARRLGGGRSIGTQRQSVAPPAPPSAAAPSATAPSGAAANPVMPAQPGAAMPGKAASSPAAAAPASGASRWLGPLAGLAAGLGLAALLSHFGLSEGFASLLLVALLIGGAVLLVRMFISRRVASPAPLQYAGSAGAGGAHPTSVPPSGGGARIEPVLMPASGNQAPVEPASAPATADATPSSRFPAGFDAEGFVRNAKLQFVALQAAHDARDRKALANVMTPKMFAEIAADLEASPPSAPTEIISLDVQVLDVTTERGDYWASVRYSGQLREDGMALPGTIDEVWHLTKPVDGSSGWLLAGIQQRS